MTDHYVRMRYSDDGGHNFSNWEEASLGAIGEYEERPVFTRLGSCYTRIWEITVSSPVRRDFMGAVGIIESMG